ncbi:MAG: transglutaminase, partial [Flavobacteriaceae bacterium]|nr:transglutaminase [Flavobacteriaceae bacterium]
YPTQETYMINIFVPEGYQVESLPQSEIFELPGGLGDFKYMISNTDNNIQLRINTSINSTLVPADFYESLKAFFEAKVTKLSEKITLIKI